MVTKVIQLYEFKELSDSAKEKAKQWYLNDPFRSQQLTEDFKESYLKCFFPNSELDVEWSLSSCQGDGVNICGSLKLSDILDYIEKWNPDEHSLYAGAKNPRGTLTDKEIKRLRFYLEYPHNSVKLMDLSHNRRYTYCCANQAEFAVDMVDDLKYWNVRNIDKKLLERFENLCIGIVKNLCAEMEHFGYKYLYEVEDEEVQESCEANEWYFTSEGKFETA